MSDRPPALHALNTPDATTLARLLSRARQDDQAAWRELISLYAPRLFALAFSSLRNHGLAEDVAQSTLATLAVQLRQGGYDEQGKFESWLFRIAMNRVRDHARARTRAATSRRAHPARATDHALEHAPDRAASHDALADEQEQQAVELDRLRAALAQLNEQDREVIELRHHAGLSFQAMADVLGQPLGTLLARHHRALQKLRTILQPDQAADKAPDQAPDRPPPPPPPRSPPSPAPPAIPAPSARSAFGKTRP